jgi:hypothetical protein
MGLRGIECDFIGIILLTQDKEKWREVHSISTKFGKILE